MTPNPTLTAPSADDMVTMRTRMRRDRYAASRDAAETLGEDINTFVARALNERIEWAASRAKRDAEARAA